MVNPRITILNYVGTLLESWHLVIGPQCYLKLPVLFTFVDLTGHFIRSLSPTKTSFTYSPYSYSAIIGERYYSVMCLSTPARDK